MLGTKEVASTKVIKGNKITLPTGFEKYSLFSDADCTKAFDTTTAITADTTIYVKLKTFTISYKVLPFDKVNPVEGETNGSMPAEYGKVFTDEEINAFAKEIDGYAYKGVFTDEACTVPFDNTNAITSDLTVYVLYGKIVPLWTPKDTAEKEVSCTMPGYQFALSYEENETYGKVLVLSNTSDVGTYDKMTLTFTNPKNLSGKLLKFDLWGDAVDEQPKVLIISGDKAQSEGYAPQILTPNVWSTGVSTLDSLKAAWSSDNSIVAADLTAVTSIQIAFQNAAANIKYGKIYITDAEGANEEILWTANALSVEDPASWTNATVSYVEDATYGSVYKVETTSEVNYPITNVAFPSPAKDFSAYEYLQITLKASAAPASDNEKIKVSIFTDGTHASEHNGCNIVAEDVGKWKSFSLKLEDFWAAWSSDNSIEKADLTKISNLKIEFGKYVGTVEIAEISLK